MKLFLAALNLGLLFIIATLVAMYYFEREYVTIRVIDDSGCKLDRYEIQLVEKSIVVSETQRAEQDFPLPSLGEYDTFISFYGRANEKGKVLYNLIAFYEDCSKKDSGTRSTELGLVIYEHIKKQQIEFGVRSD